MLPVIMITGEDNEKMKWKAESYGFDGFLKKPFGIEELMDAVDRILKRPAVGQGD